MDQSLQKKRTYFQAQEYERIRDQKRGGYCAFWPDLRQIKRGPLQAPHLERLNSTSTNDSSDC